MQRMASFTPMCHYCLCLFMFIQLFWQRCTHDYPNGHKQKDKKKIFHTPSLITWVTIYFLIWWWLVSGDADPALMTDNQWSVLPRGQPLFMYRPNQKINYFRQAANCNHRGCELSLFARIAGITRRKGNSVNIVVRHFKEYRCRRHLSDIRNR